MLYSNKTNYLVVSYLVNVTFLGEKNIIHWACNKSNTTGATSGVGTDYPSGAPEFTPGFQWVHVARSLVFLVVFCKLLFVLLAIVLSV